MKKYLYVLSALFIVGLLASCASDEVVEDVAEPQVMHTYRMKFTGDVSEYGSSTRATKTWNTGDVIYVYFNEFSSLGTATYDGSEWTISVAANLTGSGTCVTSRVENPAGEVANGIIPLSPNGALYYGSGTWNVMSGIVTVDATLGTTLARLRFKGTAGTNFTVSGIYSYGALNLSGKWSGSKVESFTSQIQSDGYSPYIYYHGFSDTSNPTLQVNGYTMTCTSNMAVRGKSGWLNLPTNSNHSGWTSEGGANEVNGHEYVDLSLSVKWATCNVGASTPEGYGDYFAWGETETKSSYDWSTYKWCNGTSSSLTKYCSNYSYGTVDNKTQLDPEDDAAHVKWGGTWRMPTYTEWSELISSCTYASVTQNGVNGCLFTGPNGNTLFVPRAGYYSDNIFNNNGSSSVYWTSTCISSSSAYYLWFDGSLTIYSADRFYGLSVRPVCP